MSHRKTYSTHQNTVDNNFLWVCTGSRAEGHRTDKCTQDTRTPPSARQEPRAVNALPVRLAIHVVHENVSGGAWSVPALQTCALIMEPVCGVHELCPSANQPCAHHSILRVPAAVRGRLKAVGPSCMTDDRPSNTECCDINGEGCGAAPHRQHASRAGHPCSDVPRQHASHASGVHQRVVAHAQIEAVRADEVPNDRHAGGKLTLHRLTWTATPTRRCMQHPQPDVIL